MAPMTVLLVDDERPFVEPLAKRLRLRGLEVDCASSGAEALARLQENTAIEVVLLDVRMPGMDGIETLKQIKETCPLVEVILLTGHATVPTAVEGIKLGAFDFLVKPCDFPTLVTKLELAARQKRFYEKRLMEEFMKPYQPKYSKRDLLQKIKREEAQKRDRN